jgi:hypothetical protein
MSAIFFLFGVDILNSEFFVEFTNQLVKKKKPNLWSEFISGKIKYIE